jgi:hypothetical protein
MPGTKLVLLVARTELWLWFVVSRVSQRCARVVARGLELQTSLTPKAVCFFDVSSDHHPNPNRCVFMHGKCGHGPGHATGRPEGNTIVCVLAGARTIAFAVEKCLGASASNAEPAAKAS